MSNQKKSRKLIIKYAPMYLRGFFEYHFMNHFGPLNPKELMLPITYQCNANCIMCNIWKHPRRPEISSQQIRQLLLDELFYGVEIVNLTGGEPTLRKDLIEIINELYNCLPHLKKLTLTTNALDTDRVVEICKEIGKKSIMNDIDFLVEVSLDGIGSIHDKIRNIPGAFKKVEKTILKLDKLSQIYDFRLGVNSVITPINLYDLNNVYNWCKYHNINIFFTITSTAENYYSNVNIDNLLFKEKEKKYLLKFLTRLSKQKSPWNFLAYYYHDLTRMIGKNLHRTIPCVFSKDAFILDAYGDMYYCIYSNKIGNCLEKKCSSIYFNPKNIIHRQEIITNKCSTCFMNCFSSIGVGKDLIKYARFLFGI